MTLTRNVILSSLDENSYRGVCPYFHDGSAEMQIRRALLGMTNKERAVAGKERLLEERLNQKERGGFATSWYNFTCSAAR
jgi:hypothetical protein